MERSTAVQLRLGEAPQLPERSRGAPRETDRGLQQNAQIDRGGAGFAVQRYSASVVDQADHETSNVSILASGFNAPRGRGR